MQQRLFIGFTKQYGTHLEVDLSMEPEPGFALQTSQSTVHRLYHMSHNTSSQPGKLFCSKLDAKYLLNLSPAMKN